MSAIVDTDEVNGKRIEILENRFGKHRYWVKVDGTALFQHGRMRLRTFTTPRAAWRAALAATQRMREKE
jgi:hypothetical protein